MSFNDKAPRTPLGKLVYAAAWGAIVGSALGLLRTSYLADRAQDTLHYPEMAAMYRHEAGDAEIVTVILVICAVALFFVADRMRRH